MLAGLIALAVYGVFVTFLLYILMYFWGKERESYRSTIDREWSEWRSMISGVDDMTPDEFLQWVTKDFRDWIQERYLR